MSKFLARIKIKIFGENGRSGSSLSSAAPEGDFKPRPVKVESSVTNDEPVPDMDGWIRVPGRDPYRIIKCGMGADTSLVEDDPGLSRRRKQIVSHGWQMCRGCGRHVSERLRGGYCEWCRGE